MSREPHEFDGLTVAKMTAIQNVLFQLLNCMYLSTELIGGFGVISTRRPPVEPVPPVLWWSLQFRRGVVCCFRTKLAVLSRAVWCMKYFYTCSNLSFSAPKQYFMMSHSEVRIVPSEHFTHHECWWNRRNLQAQVFYPCKSLQRYFPPASLIVYIQPDVTFYTCSTVFIYIFMTSWQC